MTPRIIFRPEAERELLEAICWYEERRPGLGGKFAKAVGASVSSILQDPLSFPRGRRDTRRSLVQRFPYVIYYQVLPDEIVVLAVMHGRRHPSLWQSRR